MHLTKNEQEIMEALWSEARPLALSDLIAASPQRGWKDRSAFSILNNLLKKGLIREVGFVHSGKTIARTFEPTLSYADFLATQVSDKKCKPTLTTLFAALLDKEDVTPGTLRELEKILAEKKAGLEIK